MLVATLTALPESRMFNIERSKCASLLGDGHAALAQWERGSWRRFRLRRELPSAPHLVPLADKLHTRALLLVDRGQVAVHPLHRLMKTLGGAASVLMLDHLLE